NTLGQITRVQSTDSVQRGLRHIHFLERWDLVLVEPRLEMDAAERLFREADARSVPVLVTSAMPKVRFGNRAFLQKPYTAQTLGLRVQHMIGTRGRNGEGDNGR